MARSKQVPIQRQASSEFFNKQSSTWTQSSRPDGERSKELTGSASPQLALKAFRSPKSDAGIVQLVIAVVGIYASFLTWAYLQERLTTTAHGSADAPTYFRFPLFLNTIQSAMAACAGLAYLAVSTPRGQPLPRPVPTRRMLPALLVAAVTSSLASPFGYAALAHVDYVTFLLAKSCKLVPLMALHVSVFRRRYPVHKYAVVAAVTAGVAVFTLPAAHRGDHRGSRGDAAPAWGLVLLAVNLLLDGLTNATQDHIFATFAPYSGPQMMVANSLLCTSLTATHLLVLAPVLAASPLAPLLLPAAAQPELPAALAFLLRYPAVWRDVLAFAVLGALGQVFIFYTLSTFSSVLLVTVTVTRKMFTMIISVLAFGHRLSPMQWAGVGMVFGGIGLEAAVARREKLAKLAGGRKDR